MFLPNGNLSFQGKRKRDMHPHLPKEHITMSSKTLAIVVAVLMILGSAVSLGGTIFPHTGPPGAIGHIGATGGAGAGGTEGTVGPAGAQGNTGSTGRAGPRGHIGATGPAGPNGGSAISSGIYN